MFEVDPALRAEDRGYYTYVATVPFMVCGKQPVYVGYVYKGSAIQRISSRNHIMQHKFKDAVYIAHTYEGNAAEAIVNQQYKNDNYFVVYSTRDGAKGSLEINQKIRSRLLKPEISSAASKRLRKLNSSRSFVSRSLASRKGIETKKKNKVALIVEAVKAGNQTKEEVKRYLLREHKFNANAAIPVCWDDAVAELKSECFVFRTKQDLLLRRVKFLFDSGYTCPNEIRSKLRESGWYYTLVVLNHALNKLKD